MANKKLARKNKSWITNIWLTKTGKQNPGNKEQKLANNYMINQKLAKIDKKLANKYMAHKVRQTKAQ